MTFKPDPSTHPLAQEIATKIDELIDKITGIDEVGDAAGALTEITIENARIMFEGSFEKLKERLLKRKESLESRCNDSCISDLTDSSCCD